MNLLTIQLLWIFGSLTAIGIIIYLAFRNFIQRMGKNTENAPFEVRIIPKDNHSTN